MKKFLNLSYYNNLEKEIPNELYLLKDLKDINLNAGIIEHYIKLSETDYGQILFNNLKDDEDSKVLKEYAFSHGVFCLIFFKNYLRKRVQVFFQMGNSIQEELFLKCSEFYRNKSSNRNVLLSILKEDFYKVSICFLSNRTVFDLIEEWIKSKDIDIVCPICGNEFNVLKFPDWVYYGSNGNALICFECPVAINPQKKEIEMLINNLVTLCNFIPNSNFSPLNNDFSSRVSPEHWVSICRVIFEMGISSSSEFSKNIFNKKFGGWFKALVSSNVLPNGIWETGRGYKCISNSGNECNSLDEMYIDNWMFERKLTTIKEPFYPKHEKYNRLGKRRADWLVNDYYVEYFGLKGEEMYDKKIIEKLKLVKDLGLKLIEIYPSDLNNIAQKLNCLI